MNEQTTSTSKRNARPANTLGIGAIDKKIIAQFKGAAIKPTRELIKKIREEALAVAIQHISPQSVSIHIRGEIDKLSPPK